MPRKTTCPIETHREIGRLLCSMRNQLVPMSVFLGNTYTMC